MLTFILLTNTNPELPPGEGRIKINNNDTLHISKIDNNGCDQSGLISSIFDAPGHITLRGQGNQFISYKMDGDPADIGPYLTFTLLGSPLSQHGEFEDEEEVEIHFV